MKTPYLFYFPSIHNLEVCSLRILLASIIADIAVATIAGIFMALYSISLMTSDDAKLEINVLAEASKWELKCIFINRKQWRLFCTVWKFKNFSTIQILREIQEFQSSENAKITKFVALNASNWQFYISKIPEIDFT